MIKSSRVPSECPDVRSLKERERTDIWPDGRTATVDTLTCKDAKRPDDRPTERPGLVDLPGRIQEERDHWRASLDQFLAKRERTAQLRKQLAEARTVGKAIRHARRLANRSAAAPSKQDREDP